MVYEVCREYGMNFELKRKKKFRQNDRVMLKGKTREFRGRMIGAGLCALVTRRGSSYND